MAEATWQVLISKVQCMNKEELIEALDQHDELVRLCISGSAQKTFPIIGTHSSVANGEIWLLLYPKEQWPQTLFGT